MGQFDASLGCVVLTLGDVYLIKSLFLQSHPDRNMGGLHVIHAGDHPGIIRSG
jgi:hypothetical protein